MKKAFIVVFIIGFMTGFFIGLVTPNDHRPEIVVSHAEEAIQEVDEAETASNLIRNGITAERPSVYVVDDQEGPSEEEILFQEHLDLLENGRIEYSRYSMNPYRTFYTLDNLQFPSLEEFCSYIGVTTTDLIASAQTLYGEADSVPYISHKAMVVWNLLNRLDTGFGGAYSLYSVVSMPGQYAGYSTGFPVTDENLSIVIDVLWRWHLEHTGVADAGRVLPRHYMYFCAYGAAGMDNKFYYLENGERFYLYPDQCGSGPYVS